MQISDLLRPECIDLDAHPDNKNDAINYAIELISRCGCLTDVEQYRKDVFAREQQFSTGLGNEIGIPHAKSAGVSKTALAVVRVRGGVDFESVDGQKVKLIFMIAAPENAPDDHLEVLSRLSTLLISEHFKEDLLRDHDTNEFISLFDKAEKNEYTPPQPAPVEDEGADYDIVAVTACPAGLSHTYMAAEALERKARELHIRIKVEADGAAGNRNQLMPEDIANAKVVIVAADRAVEMDRFIGKKLIRVGVADGVRNPEGILQQAMEADCPVYDPSEVQARANIVMKLYRHLMSGLTYILPLVTVAGILASVAHLEAVSASEWGDLLGATSANVSSLILPVLSAFIAFSIAGRTGLVAGFSGGVMASVSASGVCGAVANGFIGGYIAFLVVTVVQRFLKGHDAIMALLLYPVLGAFLTALVAEFATNVPLAALDQFIMKSIAEASMLQLIITGAVVGSMMAADMGGPCNKIAYALGVFLLADSFPNEMYSSTVMAAVMIGGMVPPIAMALAVLISKSRFSLEERKLAVKSAVGGFLFITETVLPFLKDHPYKMRAACIIGSAVAGACALMFKVRVCAPHGGILIAPLASEALYFLLSLLLGVVTGSICVIAMRFNIKHKEI